MNATPLLAPLLGQCAHEKLEVVLIGNAAAAIHGVPVTTLDFDFMFRETPANMRKLKRVAAALGAVILRPYYPVSRFYRMTHDLTGLQADFMPVIHGIRSFEGLKSRAVSRDIDGLSVLVASLADIIANTRAADCPQDRAVLPVIEEFRRIVTKPANPSAKTGLATASHERPLVMPARKARRRKTSTTPRAGRITSAGKPAAGRDEPPTREQTLDALPAESRRQLEDLIRRRLALPLEQRMNFLRRRLPGGGSCL